jgi:NADH dehydrogenase
MSGKVVVLGAGYAGTTVVKELESRLSAGRLTWVSDTDYHFVLHEAHRIISDPTVEEKIALPIADVKATGTEFVQGEVVGVDVDDRTVELRDGRTVEYDYLVIALGSQTAFYGIPGMREHALTLKSLDDALAINEAVREAARTATRTDPATVVIGGAGLSGVQSAGEIAEFRDHHRAPVEITLVEALEEIMPGQDPSLQAAVRRLLEERDVNILVDDPITAVTDEAVEFDEGDPLDYDVLLWTGGITGRDALDGADLDANHNRVEAHATFETSDERVFALGDSALVEQGDDVAPPTAQAAWQAGEVAAENVIRRTNGHPLRTWTYHDRGTLVSVGETAVAHGVDPLPVETFDAYPATVLKKFVAARWIADVTSWPRALSAWDAL